MKLHFLLAFLASACFLSAQSPLFERNVSSSFYNRFQKIFPGDHGNYKAIFIGDEGLSSSPIIAAEIDSAGTVKLVSVNTFGISVHSDVIPAQNEGYFHLASIWDCDIIAPGRLYRVGSDGQMLWSYTLADNIYQQKYYKLLPGAWNSAWLFGDSIPAIQIIDDGLLLNTSTQPYPLFNGYVELGNNQALTYGPGGIWKYETVFLEGQHVWTGPTVIKADTLGAKRCAVLTGAQLLVLDSTFNVLHAIDHAIPDSTILDMSASGNQILVLAKGKLYRYDSNLNLVSTSTVPASAHYEPRFLHLTANRLDLFGEENKMPYQAAPQILSIHAVSPDQPWTTTQSDASVFAIRSKYPVGQQSMTSWGYSMDIDSIFVTVKNEGAVPLHSVYLNAVLDPVNYMCGPEQVQYLNKFDNLNVTPGDTIRLWIGKLHWSRPEAMLPHFYSLCFWTTLPNDSLDASPDNNRLCQDLAVTVGTNDPNPPLALNIFPNPADGDVEVRLPNWPDLRLTAQLIDLNGRIVRQESWSQPQWTLKRDGLPAGLYRIRAWSEAGQTFVAKLIWE